MLKKSAWLLLCVLYHFSISVTFADTVAADASSAVPATAKLAVTSAASAVVPATTRPAVPIAAHSAVANVTKPAVPNVATSAVPTASVSAVQTTVKPEAQTIAKPAEHTITKVSEHPVIKHSEPVAEKPTIFTSIKAALPKNKAEAVPASSPDETSPQTDFPVLLSDTEIIIVSSSPIGSLTPENRAKIIQQNITTFADSEADTSELKIVSLPEGLSIGNNATTLLLITDQDAEKAGKDTTQLAKEVLGKIQMSVTDYRKHHNWKVYGMGAAFTTLSIILLWQALVWNNRLFVWLMRKVSSVRKYWKNGIHFKEIEVLSAKRIETMVVLSLKFFRTLVVLLCLYFFLPLTLSFFPETRKLGGRLFEYLLTPFVSIFQTVINIIPNLFYIFVIIVIAFYVLKLILYVFTLIENGELEFEWFYDDWAKPTYQIIRFLVIVTALISAYPYIPGSSSNAFQGVGLVLGAIISFASSSAISNIVAGVILTYTRAFRLNDRIKVGDTTGDVVEKTLLVTRIMTIKQVIVTIPNSLVMGSQIVNYSTSAADGEGLILHTSVTIGYDVPWEKVQALLIEAALATKDIQQTPTPFVLQTSLDDFYVSYEINGFTKEPHRMAKIYSNLHQNILAKFDAAGVEIMSPHYYAVRDGNLTSKVRL